MKLSDITVKSIKGNGKVQKFFDGKGLYLYVTEEGKKFWRLAYRFGGKQKTLSIGPYELVSLKEARDKRDEAKRLLLEGIDPGEQKKADRLVGLEIQFAADNTFEAIAREWYPIRQRQVSEKQAHRVLRYLETKVFPVLGAKLISEIKAPEVLQIIRPVEEEGKHTTADKILSACSQVFDYAMNTGRIEHNPILRLRKALVGGQVQNLAAVTDPKDIAELLRKIDGVNSSFSTLSYLKILPYVFTRPSELRLAKWGEFNFEEKLWTIPAERMKMRKEHIVPLSRQVMELLQALRVFSGRESYLFPSPHIKTPVISDSGALRALRQTGFEPERMCLHGFRSMASTRLNEMGKFRPDVIEACLAHKEPDAIRLAYNRAQYMEERRFLMQSWADYLNMLRQNSQHPILPISAIVSIN